MFGWFKRNPVAVPAGPLVPRARFSTHAGRREPQFTRRSQLFDLPKPVRTALPGVVMDDENEASDSLKPVYGLSTTIPEAQIGWYASQGFIGYQLMAIIAQHWLVDKACRMPGNDAVRKGYDLTIDDGTKIDAKIMSKIKRLDKRYKFKWHLQEFIAKGRIFGIRIALFKVRSDDPEYYEKPFNIDGCGPGCYEGISQIDPYWIVPELTNANVQDPSDLHFYEPEFWNISGYGRVHRTHLVIFTTGQVADVLKPMYFYGGVSIPQKIYERVYASERSANEGPMLLLTKRLNVQHVDMEAAVADEVTFSDRVSWQHQQRDNFGTLYVGTEDVVEKLETTLTDLPATIMTQYQLVAAIAEVPGTKLLGTQPKGFNSTGDYEEASYHEFLETLRSNEMEPLCDRHYLLLHASWFKVNLGDFDIGVSWNELDSMTALEQAQCNAEKAGTDAALIATGQIDPIEGRQRLINDPDSGYTGLPEQPPPMPQTAGGVDPDAQGGPPGPAGAAAFAVKPVMPKAGKVAGA